MDLGKGTKDGGVDVRVWTDREAKAGPPMMLIQCKRYKDVVGIETVKAFWADVHFRGRREGSDRDYVIHLGRCQEAPRRSQMAHVVCGVG